MLIEIMRDGRARAHVPGIGGASMSVVHEFARRAVHATAVELDPDLLAAPDGACAGATCAPALCTAEPGGDWVEVWVEAASLTPGVTHVLLVCADGADALLLGACVPLGDALAQASAIGELLWVPVPASALVAAPMPSACLRLLADPAPEPLHDLFMPPAPGAEPVCSPSDALQAGLRRVRALATWPITDARAASVTRVHDELFSANDSALGTCDEASLATAVAIAPLLPAETADAWLRGELAVIARRTHGLAARRDDLGLVLARAAATRAASPLDAALDATTLAWLTEVQLAVGLAELAAGRAWPGVAPAAAAHIWRGDEALALLRTCPEAGKMAADRRALLAGGMLCVPPLPELAAALYGARLRRLVAAHQSAPRAAWLPASAEDDIAQTVADINTVVHARTASSAYGARGTWSGARASAPLPPLAELVARADELAPPCMRAALRAGYVDNTTRFALFTFFLKLGYDEAAIAEHAAQAWACAVPPREWATSDAATNLRDYARTQAQRGDGARGFGVGCANLARGAHGLVSCPHAALRDIEEIGRACRANCGVGSGGAPGWSPQRYTRAALRG